jgi:DNA polymerase theta
LTSSTTPPQLAYICVPPEDAAAGRAPPAAESARWQALDTYCRALSPAEAGVAARVGLSLGWLGAAARGGAPPRAASAGAAGAADRPAAEAASDEHRRVARRFWTALALAELLREAPPAAVAQRFGADAAVLRTLRERAARHAAMLAALAERLGWGDLEALLTRFQGRLCHGVRSELLPLMEVPGLKPWAARRLYAAGLRAPEALAAVSSLEQLASVLAAGAPGGPGGGDAAHWRQAAARAVRGARELLAARAREMGDAAAAAAHAAAGRGEGGGQGGVEGGAAPGGADAAVADAADAADAALCAAAAASDSVTVAAAGVAAAALEAPPAAEADPGADAWELGELRGAVVLAERRHVLALVALVRARYARFGFVLDIAEPAAAGGAAGALAPPPGPSAARMGARPPPAGALAATRVEGAAVCWRDGVAFYVPLAARPDLADALAPLFADAELEKVTFDLKGQLAALTRAADAAAAGAGAGAGVGDGAAATGTLLALAGPLVDVRVAAFLATPDDGRLGDGSASAPSAAARGRTDGAPHTLAGLAASRLGASAAAAAAAGMAPPAGAPPGAGRRRHEACRDAALARRTAVSLGATLSGLGLVRALREVEMPAVPALAALEAAGVCIDAAALRRDTAALAARCAALDAAAAALLGAPLDFLSPPDVSAALYEKLRLPVPPGAARLKSGGGWSADSKALHWLIGAAGGRCPLPAMVVEYRKLSKASAFADGLLALCAVAAPVPGTGGSTFRVRGHVNHTMSVTGRLSMDVPNLTTVPKPTAFPLPGGPPGGAPAGAEYVHRCALRRALRAPPGCLLLSADFRQLELRMVAHHSGCAALAAALSARDPFEAMAAHWRGLPPGTPVAPADRADAKQLVYALLYGSGAGVVARALGEHDETRARRMADAFQARFPGVRAWAAAVRAGAARGRCPPSLAGRTRPLAGGRGRGAPGRFAVNFAGQGSAADVAKLALAALPAALAAAASPGAARVVLAVHDEFVLEVREEHVAAVAEALRAAMVGAPAALGGLQLRVPLDVALKVGPTWGEMAAFGGDGEGGAAADDDDDEDGALLGGEEEEDEGDEAES